MNARFQTARNGAVIGVLEIPTATPGKVTASAVGDSAAEALARAALVAERIADDPVMCAIMAPSAMDSIRAVRALATAALDGPDALRDAMSEMHGKGARRLARALHIEAVKRVEREPWNTDAGARYQDLDTPVDIVNGRGPEVAGFWDSVKSVATMVGTEAWKQAKAHQKEIAMAAATAALGPAGGIAAGKAMDLVTAAQAGSAPAKKAVEQVATQAKAGNPRAKLMLSVITRTVKQDAATADHRADPGPTSYAPAPRPAPAPQPDDGTDEANEPPDDDGADYDDDGDADNDDGADNVNINVRDHRAG